MWLFFIFVLAVALLKDAMQSYKSKQNYNQMVNHGAFLPIDPIKSDIIKQDVTYDWNHERTLFNPNYIEYLKLNSEALAEYRIALQCQKELSLGLKPTLRPPVFDKNTYDPFFRFNARYREKAKIYNETGKYYA